MPVVFCSSVFCVFYTGLCPVITWPDLKIVLLTFKVCFSQPPNYLIELLIPYKPNVALPFSKTSWNGKGDQALQSEFFLNPTYTDRILYDNVHTIHSLSLSHSLYLTHSLYLYTHSL